MPQRAFTDSEIYRIRTNLEDWSDKEWAALFRVGLETIRRIRRFETYVRVGEDPRQVRPTGLTPEQASIQRIVQRSGVVPKVIPLGEEPSQEELARADSRLSEEVQHSAEQMLSELMRQDSNNQGD